MSRTTVGTARIPSINGRMERIRTRCCKWVCSMIYWKSERQAESQLDKLEKRALPQGRRHNRSCGVMHSYLFQMLVFLMYWLPSNTLNPNLPMHWPPTFQCIAIPTFQCIDPPPSNSWHRPCPAWQGRKLVVIFKKRFSRYLPVADSPAHDVSSARPSSQTTTAFCD